MHKYLEDSLFPKQAGQDYKEHQDYSEADANYIFRLIHLLCLPEMKIFLDTTRLVAKYTDNLLDELWSYIKDGKLAHTAVLLLAAQEQIRMGTSCKKKGTSKQDGFRIINERILDNLITLQLEKAQNRKERKQAEAKIKLHHTTMMFVRVISKAGEALDSYIRNHLEVPYFMQVPCLEVPCLERLECSQPASSDFQPGEWAEAVSGFHIEDIPYIDTRCPVLVQDALHFMLVYSNNDDGDVGILKYNLSSNSLSVIDAPFDAFVACDATILMAMEDGSLGFAYVDGLNLFLWSRQLASDGEASWVEYKMVNLKELIPNLNPVIRLTLVGSVEGRDIIFVNTCLGICEINLKTLQWKKIWKREEIHSLVPYTSFYSPEPEEL